MKLDENGFVVIIVMLINPFYRSQFYGSAVSSEPPGLPCSIQLLQQIATLGSRLISLINHVIPITSAGNCTGDDVLDSEYSEHFGLTVFSHHVISGSIADGIRRLKRGDSDGSFQTHIGPGYF